MVEEEEVKLGLVVEELDGGGGVPAVATGAPAPLSDASVRLPDWTAEVDCGGILWM